MVNNPWVSVQSSIIVASLPQVMSIFGFLGWLRDRFDEDPKALTELEESNSIEHLQLFMGTPMVFFHGLGYSNGGNAV